MRLSFSSNRVQFGFSLLTEAVLSETGVSVNLSSFFLFFSLLERSKIVVCCLGGLPRFFWVQEFQKTACRYFVYPLDHLFEFYSSLWLKPERLQNNRVVRLFNLTAPVIKWSG